jgi:hypothetical protein
VTASTWRRQDEIAFLLNEPESDLDSLPLSTGMNSRAVVSFSSEDELDSTDEDEELSLPSAGVANVRGSFDSDEENNDDAHDDVQDVDIGEFDWGEADKEVNEFLAEFGEDGAFTTDESDTERYPSVRIGLN